jgi:hypothetical protein
MKKTIISMLVMILTLCLVQFAYAGVINGDGFSIVIDVDDDTVKPGESFNVEVEVTNNISSDIEDINVEVVIKDLDEGDDFEDDDDISDLDVGDDDDIDFDFDVPYAVKEKDYEIIVIVTGDDASNSSRSYKVIKNETVEVKKDKHELYMKAPTVDFETLKCSRSTESSVTLYNIGDKDEEVSLTVYNTELGINQKLVFDLDEGDDEDDIKTTKRFSLDLVDAAEKTYTFYAVAEYDDGDERETESFKIKVTECETATSSDSSDDVTTTPISTTTPVTTVPVTTPVTTNPVTTPVVSVPSIVEETFIEQYGAALLLGLAYVVVIIVGILLVVSLLKKK